MQPSEILKQIRELNETWRKQNFSFTQEQKATYSKLRELRRERVKYFHDNDMVSKGGLRPKEKEDSTK
tara:strand:- start:684 stop:887 length:204 start_codon:yes stop_codon:yes gene_type:complete